MMRKFDSEPGHERIEIALLRSPIALVDVEVSSIRAAWNRAAREQNPSEAIAIAEGRHEVEWGRHALLTAAAKARSATRWDDKRILERLITSKNNGYAVYGFTTGDVVNARNFLKRKA